MQIDLQSALGRLPQRGEQHRSRHATDQARLFRHGQESFRMQDAVVGMPQPDQRLDRDELQAADVDLGLVEDFHAAVLHALEELGLGHLDIDAFAVRARLDDLSVQETAQ